MGNHSDPKLALTVCLFLSQAIVCAADSSGLPDFTSLSLDQLANVKITSFTKRQQRLSQVAGAVYVITQEQIARSGLTSVPELLRLAPGIDVVRVNGSQWSISARGTVGVYSNKLLVLIDGRSLYSPIFAGVYWELGMPLLDDIERIEVIRGPGATIWGANAVLGVINIITKSSKEVRGTTFSAAAGTSDRVFGSLRSGGALGTATYRGYVGGSDNGSLADASGRNAGDGWSNLQAGFRMDGSKGRNLWMLAGDMFRASETEMGEYISLPAQRVVQTPSQFNSVAGNIASEWRRPVGESGELRVQAYYDHVNRPEPQVPSARTDIIDIETQYDLRVRGIHNISVGAGERLLDVQLDTREGISFSHPSSIYSNANAFTQDEIHFAHDTVLITLGAKLEHNHFGGWGVEPSVNAMWMPSKIHSAWISAARSLRTPTQLERSLAYPYTIVAGSAATGGLAILAQINGSDAFSPESVRDFEAGYRTQVSKALSFDLTAFYDQYSGLRSYLPQDPEVRFAQVPYLLVNEAEGNLGRAVGKGMEVSTAWGGSRAWKLEGSYTYNIVNPYFGPEAPAGTIDAGGKLPSHNKWRLQSYVNISKKFNFDTFLYWTSQGSPTNAYGPPIPVPSYLRFDVRVAYKLRPNWEISAAGQNLLEQRHLEGLTEVLTGYSYVTRNVYLKSTWHF